jgi:hypothetical protein
MVSDMRFPVYRSGRLRSSPSLVWFRVFRRTYCRHASRDPDRRRGLAQAQQAHRIADKVILDRANLLTRKVSRVCS